MRKFVGAGAFALLVAVAPAARAQSAQAAAAEALFQEGLAAAERHELDVACARFRDSDKVDPANGTKLALAECEENRGKLATSWSLFKATLEKLPPTDKRIATVKGRIAALEARLPKLVVTIAPDAPKGTTVTEGEAPMLPSMFGLALPTDPGVHTFVVKADGYEDATLKVEAREKQTASLVARPGPAKRLAPVVVAAPVQPKTAEPTPRPPPSTPAQDNRTAGWIVGGVGVAGVGVGVVSYVLALGKKSVADDNCSGELQLCNPTGRDAADSAKTLNVVTVTSFALGAVGLGVGTWMLIKPSPERTTSAALGPAIVAGAPGWGVGGTW